MSKKAVYLLGIVFTILLGTWLYIIYCCDCYNVLNNNIDTKETIEKESIDSTNSNSVEINKGFGFKGKELDFNCSDNFLFNKSNFNLLLPISDSINLGISKLKEQLGKTSSKFHIKGFYTSDEVNNSIFPNLGLARANGIKNYLVEQGIPEGKLELFGELNENDPVFRNDTIFNAASFEWLEVDENEASTENWSVVKNQINADPLVLYFNTGQATIELSEGDKQKIATIVDYLNHVKDSKIIIEGHTDNVVGPRNTNLFYSEERANFAKKYFITNGISEEKMEAYGRGSTKPIADNNTNVGRAKNRRTEVTIK